MIGAVTTVVGNYHFGLTGARHLLNSTTTYKTVSSKFHLYANILECDACMARLWQNIYMNLVANVYIFFITLIATGIHSRLGKK